MTGKTVERPIVADATLLGAAMFCRCAVDASVNLPDLSRQWIEVPTRYEPEPSAHHRYLELAAVFDEYIRTNAGIFRKLSQLETNPRQETSSK